MNRHASAQAWSRDALWAVNISDTPVLLLDADGAVVHANPACHRLVAALTPPEAPDALMAALPRDAWATARAQGRWAGEVDIGATSLAVHLYSGELDGAARGFAVLADVTAGKTQRGEMQRRHDELQETYQRLAGTQEQLLQSEKLASIGQLAAGVAHEINNPIGYVHSNLGTLHEYAGALLAMIECLDDALQSDDPKARRAEVLARRERLDIDFIVGDLPKLLAESSEGIERVTKIVQDLKDFSRSSGSGEPMQPADLHKGLESTINIVWNELKYKVELERHYGELPAVECHASEINQVLMTLLINAGQAIDKRGRIVIASGCESARDGHGDEAWISIADSGCGIAPEVLPRIFEPFFTTKPIGRGTGLGLAVAYSIVKKHGGRIEVSSRPGQGSIFRLVLPVAQPGAQA